MAAVEILPSSTSTSKAGARWIRLGCYFLMGILVALVALEVVLRFLPVSRGLFRTLEVDRWPLHAYTAHSKYTYSMAWDFQNPQSGYTNNYGHLAPFDFVKGSRPIIVLGNSFIEAQMLRYSDTLQAQLRSHTESTVPVYGMGFSGNSFGEYLAMAAAAKYEFEPRAAVVLVVDGDISESIGPRAGHYFFRFMSGRPFLDYHASRGPSLARRIREPIGDSAIYRYVFSNLRFSPSDLVDWSVAAPATAEEAKGQEAILQEREIVDVFLGEFSVRSGVPKKCTAFLLDSDRVALYEPGYAKAPDKDNSGLRQYFLTTAERAGYHVVDMGGQFVSHYRLHHQRFDFWPIDRHWNWLGHKLAAEAAFAALRTCVNIR